MRSGYPFMLLDIIKLDRTYLYIDLGGAEKPTTARLIKNRITIDFTKWSIGNAVYDTPMRKKPA